MALRKASAYSKKTTRPYTRKSSRKNKAYIKTVPYSKIVKFTMGDAAAFKGNKHKFMISLVSEQGVMLRDTSLEAARMLLHKILEEKAPGQYYSAIKVYPHHMIRENKTAAGAGADRVSTGMTQSFGIVIGRMAIVRPGQQILFVSCADEKIAQEIKDSMSAIKAKFPCKTRIIYEKLA
jgi:large subunit ribosomal protein L10e